MRVLAIALAASLLSGPAPDAAPSEGEAAGIVIDLPNVDDPVEAVPTPEFEAVPEPEIEAPPSVERPPAPIPRDGLGCVASKSCRKMSIAGIFVGVLGVAAIGTGIGLVVRRDEVIPESPAFVSSTRPAGTVVLTLGAGVTLTAVLMLIAAHRGAKPRQSARRVELLGDGLRF